MENVIGWILVSMLLVIPALVIWAGFKLYKRTKLKQQQAEQEWMDAVRADAASKREAARREMNLAQDRAKRLKLKEPTAESLKKVKEMPNASYSSTPASTAGYSNDSLLSDLATMYVLNSALQHGSASAKIDYDTGTIKTDNSSSSSWGLDDSDSRKSASDSFSSSSSSSSWDSGSSSSDSGPSSDW